MEPGLRCREGLFDLVGCGSCQHIACCSGVTCPLEAVQSGFDILGSVPRNSVSCSEESESQAQVDEFCILVQSTEV